MWLTNTGHGFLVWTFTVKGSVISTRSIGATVVAAYSPRVRAGVPVSFPLEWDELDPKCRHVLARDPEDLAVCFSGRRDPVEVWGPAGEEGHLGTLAYAQPYVAQADAVSAARVAAAEGQLRGREGGMDETDLLAERLQVAVLARDLVRDVRDKGGSLSLADLAARHGLDRWVHHQRIGADGRDQRIMFPELLAGGPEIAARRQRGTSPSSRRSRPLPA